MSGRKNPISGAAIGTLLVIALVAYWPITPPPPHTPGLTEENFKKLHAAMKRGEVVALFGGELIEVDKARLAWLTDNRWVTVQFDSNGFAYLYTTPLKGSEVYNATVLEETWFIKVQRWFRGWTG